MNQNVVTSLTGIKTDGIGSNVIISPSPRLSSRGEQVECLLLVAFALVLPLFEAPKNILVLAYAMVWLFNRVRSGQWGGPWDCWDSLFALLLGSYLASVSFGHFGAHAAGDFGDPLRFIGLAWLVRRAGYGAPFCILLLRGFLYATVATVFVGFWDLFVAGLGPYLELRSVGHVNHSAIYLALAALIAQCLWQLDRRDNAFHARLDLVLIVFMFVVQIVMASRASLLGYLAAAIILLIRDRTYFTALGASALRKGAAVILVSILCTGALMSLSAKWMPGGGVFGKITSNTKEDRLLSLRDRVWAFGVEGWRVSPAFGIGTGQFDRLKLDDVCNWRAERLSASGLSNDANNCPRDSYFKTAHAHSLYVTALVERGVIGLFILIAFLAAWFMAVWKQPDTSAAATINSAAGSALIVAMVTGVANTTLHHEHGLLSLCLLALWLGLKRQTRRHANDTDPVKTEVKLQLLRAPV